MAEDQKNGLAQDPEEKTKETELSELSEEPAVEPDSVEELKKFLSELNDKHLRLYADFENYRKLEAKNKEELIKYSNEKLIKDILTVIDHLELALQHSSDNEASSSLADGVELTLKELKNILEKYGLVNIDALGKPFDPHIHHAMSQIETKEVDDNTVVTEFRKGYMLKGRVLRAALVGVSKKTSQPGIEAKEQKQKTD